MTNTFAREFVEFTEIAALDPILCSSCIGTSIPFDMTFDWNSDEQGLRQRGWSISGEYWTEISFDGS